MCAHLPLHSSKSLILSRDPYLLGPFSLPPALTQRLQQFPLIRCSFHYPHCGSQRSDHRFTCRFHHPFLIQCTTRRSCVEAAGSIRLRSGFVNETPSNRLLGGRSCDEDCVLAASSPAVPTPTRLHHFGPTRVGGQPGTVLRFTGDRIETLCIGFECLTVLKNQVNAK